MKRQMRKGFTLIELLVVVAIIALLISILLPSLGRARELANRSACAANIKGILTSMAVYGNENNDVLPLGGTMTVATTVWNNALNTAALSTATTSSVALQSMHNQAVGDTSATNKILNPLWMMVLTQQVSPKSFLCKSDPSASSTAASVTDGSGYNLYFRTATEVSYSIAYPWAYSANTGAGAAAYWRNTTDSSLPLMADMAPQNGSPINLNSTTDNKARSSYNHNREGQNVGFADAHSEWSRSPAVGQSQDDIWTITSNTSSPQSSGGTLTVASGATSASGTVPGSFSSSKFLSATPFDIFMAPVTSGTRSGTAGF
jgi:prepilin-type N-terminal cleavage/methylation domain-containing protein